MIEGAGGVVIMVDVGLLEVAGVVMKGLWGRFSVYLEWGSEKVTDGEGGGVSINKDY